MADENEFGGAGEITEEELGDGMTVVVDEADEPVVDDVVVEDDALPEEKEEEEEEDPFKIGLEEILDPNGDNQYDER